MHPIWKVTFYNTIQFCDNICGAIMAAKNCLTTLIFMQKQLSLLEMLFTKKFNAIIQSRRK